MANTALTQTDPEIDWLTEATRISQLATAHYTIGRPDILHDTYRIHKVLKAVADGNYKQTAALIAGIAKQTLYNIEADAKQGHIPAIAFLDAMEKAEAQAEGEMVNCVRGAAKAGPQFWAAGMTYLERRQPDRWGKRQDDSAVPKVVVQIGVSQGDVQVSLSPSPQLRSIESETLQIQAINPSESDKAGYVNHAKSLIPGAIDAPQRSEGEGERKPRGPARRGKRRGTLARAKASQS